MARRGNDDIAEERVPLDEIALRTGYPIAVIQSKLEESEIFERWDHVLCVRGSRATEILDELRAAVE
jgi:hypothetical protein